MKLKKKLYALIFTTFLTSNVGATNPGAVDITVTVNGSPQTFSAIAYRFSDLPGTIQQDYSNQFPILSALWWRDFQLSRDIALAYDSLTSYRPNNITLGDGITTIIGGPLVPNDIFANPQGDDVFSLYVNGPNSFTGISTNELQNLYFLFLALIPSGPSAEDTQSSFRLNALALRNTFNLQSAKIAQGLSYDCTVYDQKNICVSFAGSKSDGKGFDAPTGALIIAHKPTNNFRIGGYIDQSFGSSTSGGLTTKKGNPGFGAFAVWSQNADGSGVQVRAAANVDKVDIETKREAIGTAEAGEGQSNIKSRGFSLEVSKDYAINSMWSARPYVGYRQTTNIRAGYAERSSNDVTAPLTYGSLKQTAETFTAGATFAHTLSAKTTMYLTAGIEHDLKNRIGDYSSTSSSIGDIDNINISSDKTKTRPTVSFALSHNIDKTQRVGLSLTHRKAAFASGSTTSAVLQYSKGF